MSSAKSSAKETTRNLSWLAVAQAGRRLLALVTTAVLARLIAPEQFGILNMAILAVGLLSMVSDVGLSSALVQRKEVGEDELSTAFWLNCLACVVLGGLGAAVAWPLSRAYHEPRVMTVLLVLLIMLPVSGLGLVSDALLQRRLHFKRISLIELSSGLAAAIVGVVLALSGAGVWALVGQYLVTSLVTAIGRLWAAGWLPKLRFSRAAARDLSGFGSGVLGVMIINYATRNIDNALIGAALGPRALGYYSLAYNLMLMPATMVAGIFSRVSFPLLSSLRGEPERLRAEYLRLVRVLATLSIPVIVGLCAVAPLFIRAVYGPNWLPVAPILRILAVVGVFEAVSTSGAVFYAMGRPHLLASWALLSLAVMVAGFAIGVHWGAPGVAWAYVAVSPVVFGIPQVISTRLIDLRFGQLIGNITPALLAAAAMAGVLLLLQSIPVVPFGLVWPDLGVYVAGGGVVYVVAIVAVVALFWRRNILGWLKEAI